MSTIAELETRVKVLEQRLGINNQIDARLAGLLNFVALQTGINVQAICGHRRHHHIVRARRIYCYLARCSGYSYHAIAFSIRPDMHHAAVLHTCTAMEEELDADSNLAAHIRLLAHEVNIQLPERYRA